MQRFQHNTTQLGFPLPLPYLCLTSSDLRSDFVRPTYEYLRVSTSIYEYLRVSTSIYITLHSDFVRTLRYIILRYITLHYIILHYINIQVYRYIGIFLYFSLVQVILTFPRSKSVLGKAKGGKAVTSAQKRNT